uniref:Putative secreted protein n=1 Tax=Panstrongylus lignarius TaxID=156445 RepID=A0A224XXY0_9HEMI
MFYLNTAQLIAFMLAARTFLSTSFLTSSISRGSGKLCTRKIFGHKSTSTHNRSGQITWRTIGFMAKRLTEMAIIWFATGQLFVANSFAQPDRICTNCSFTR